MAKEKSQTKFCICTDSVLVIPKAGGQVTVV